MRKMLTIAATVAALCVGATAFSPAVRAGTNRPFKGSARGAITLFAPPTLVIDTAGNATHLGNFTRHETITFTGPGTFVGHLAFVAANGDELDADLAGHFVSADDAVGTYTFTGGTGRFSDATGTATFAASKSGLDVALTFKGTIDY